MRGGEFTTSFLVLRVSRVRGKWSYTYLKRKKPPLQINLKIHHKVVFAVVQSLSYVRLFVTLWTTACPASLSFTISQNLLKLTSIESVMPSNHLILCCSLFLLPSIFPSIREVVFRVK